MMTEAEVQLVTYVEAVMRQRGYPDLAETLHGVIDTQVERRASIGLRTASSYLLL